VESAVCLSSSTWVCFSDGTGTGAATLTTPRSHRTIMGQLRQGPHLDTRVLALQSEVGTEASHNEPTLSDSGSVHPSLRTRRSSGSAGPSLGFPVPQPYHALSVKECCQREQTGSCARAHPMEARSKSYSARIAGRSPCLWLREAACRCSRVHLRRLKLKSYSTLMADDSPSLLWL
jgi:hypothetical protein